MNIILINHYAGSPKYGMEYRPYYLAKEWVKDGHNVSIVAASFSHVRTHSPKITGGLTKQSIDGIRYFWLKTPRYQGNGFRRVVNMFTFVLQVLKYKNTLCNKYKPDVVIASSTYPLDIIAAYKIARTFNAKLIFEVHDLWPLSPIELGGMSKWHPFIMLMQWAENYAYKNANTVVSMLPNACKHMCSHGMKKDKFIHIPNGIKIDEWDNENITLPDEYKIIFDNLMKDKRFLVGYIGSHGLANSLDTLVESAILLQKHPVTIVLVGNGPEKKTLQEKVKINGINNILFLSPVEKKMVPKLLSYLDVAYIGLKKQPLFKFGISPNKLMDYMMAGKPIIQAIEAGNDLVVESGCGISVMPENPVEITNAIVHLMNLTSKERNEMGVRGNTYVRKNHDYKVLAKLFLGEMQ